MKQTARLTIGDWSHDGHNETSTITIDIHGELTGKTSEAEKPHKGRGWGCSKEPDLWFYYNLAVKAGIPDVTEVCSDYGDSLAPVEMLKEWSEKLGVKFDVLGDDDEDDYIDCDEYAAVWVAMVNKGIELSGASNGRVEIVPDSVALNYNIGGYGFFG